MKKPICKVFIEKENDELGQYVCLNFHSLEDMDNAINILNEAREEFEKRLNKYYEYKKKKNERKKARKSLGDDKEVGIDNTALINHAKNELNKLRENIKQNPEFQFLEPLIRFVEKQLDNNSKQ